MFGPGQGRLWPEDEKNLLYVAITRAKNNLVMNSLVRNEIVESEVSGLHRLSLYRQGEPVPSSCGSGPEECKAHLSKELLDTQLICRQEEFRLSTGAYSQGEGLGGLNSDLLRASKLYCVDCSLKMFPLFRMFFNNKDASERGKKRKREV